MAEHVYGDEFPFSAAREVATAAMSRNFGRHMIRPAGEVLCYAVGKVSDGGLMATADIGEVEPPEQVWRGVLEACEVQAGADAGAEPGEMQVVGFPFSMIGLAFAAAQLILSIIRRD